METIATLEDPYPPSNYEGHWHEVTVLSDPDTFEKALARADDPSSEWEDTTLPAATWWLSCPPEPDAQCIEDGGQVCRIRALLKSCPGDYRASLWVESSSLDPEDESEPVLEEITVITTLTESNCESGVWVSFELPLKPCRIYSAASGITFERIPEPGQAGDAGCQSPELNSAHMTLALGAASDGFNAGYITYEAQTLGTAAYEAGALSFKILAKDGSVTLSRDSAGVVREINAPDADVLIVDLFDNTDPIGFAVEFYAPGGSYTTLVSAWHFTKDDPGALRIARTAGGAGQAYAFTQSGGGWTLDRNSLAVEALEKTTESGHPVEIRTIKEPGISGATVFKEKTVYDTDPFGEPRKIQSILNPDFTADSQTTTWNYHAGTNRLDFVEYPDGRWERYTYATNGDYVLEIFPWRDSLRTDTDLSHHHYFETLRDTITLSGVSVKRATRIERIAGQEVSRRYALTWIDPVEVVLAPSTSPKLTRQVWEVDASSPGAAWDASGNLVTKISYDLGSGERWRTLRPDGTMVLQSKSPSYTGGYIITVQTGVPDTALVTVVDGVLQSTETNGTGQVVREESRDIQTDLLLSQRRAVSFENNDPKRGRPLVFTHLDGTTESRSYACCGKLATWTDRDGVSTAYGYDTLGRLTDETRLGIVTRHDFDAAGRLTKTTRIGTDESEIVLSETGYDLAGRVLWTRNASEVLHDERTDYAYSLSTGGGLSRTATRTADGATTIETYHRDGRMFSNTGTATPPARNLYGVTTGGQRWTQTIAIGDDETETEWTKTYTDFLGRTVKIEYPDTAEITYGYDAAGRLVRQTDPDGVQALYAYDAHGERTVTALDLDRDGFIDYDGADRITRTTTALVTLIETSDTVSVQRTTTEVWTETDTTTAAGTIIAITDVSLDGLTTSQTTYGLTTRSQIAYGPAGTRTETTTAPDGSRLVRTYQYGRLAGELHQDGAPSPVSLSETSYAYDEHGRMKLRSLLHTPGDPLLTVYTWFDDDQLHSITTPDPDTTRSGIGYAPQTTTYHYDTLGRVDLVTSHDGAQAHTTYWPTGRVKRTWGDRTYPVEHAYDPQGRLRTMTTWKDFAGESGAAVTTWHYHTQRGWRLDKRYPDGTGSDYDYYPSGRLKTRNWARTVPGAASRLRTTYTYNNAGDLATIDYSDATPDLAHTYDRLGRLHTTTDAAGLLTRSYNHGRLDDETYSSAAGTSNLLANRSVTRTQDSLHRIETLSVPSSYSVGYSYDEAGRLATVAQGSKVATLGYHLASGLPDSITIAVTGVDRFIYTREIDRLGRIASVQTTDGASTILAATAYTYNDANQRIRAEQADTRRWIYGYDAFGQVNLAQKRLSDDTTVLPGHDFAFAYDDIGNRTAVTVNDRVRNYTSDLLNRYLARGTPLAIDVNGEASTGATVLVNDEPTLRTGADFYRAAPVTGLKENLIKIQAVSSSPERVATEIRSVLMPAVPESYAYDADGNLVQDGLWTYEWDAENRLVAQELRADVTTTLRQRLEFAYDYQGRRIRKVVKHWNSSAWTTDRDLRFLYDGWHLLAEYSANLVTGHLSLVTSHVWGLDLSGSWQGAGGVGGLLWVNLASDSFAPGYDGNGNIVAWVNTATMTVSGRADYGSFGEPVMQTGVARELPFGFSTKYFDRETGLNYYGYRYYNPSTGRWLSRDPIEENGGLNLYGMVGNDGVNFFDVLGESPHGRTWTEYHDLGASASGHKTGDMEGYVEASGTFSEDTMHQLRRNPYKYKNGPQVISRNIAKWSAKWKFKCVCDGEFPRLEFSAQGIDSTEMSGVSQLGIEVGGSIGWASGAFGFGKQFGITVYPFQSGAATMSSKVEAFLPKHVVSLTVNFGAVLTKTASVGGEVGLGPINVTFPLGSRSGDLLSHSTNSVTVSCTKHWSDGISFQ